MEKLLTAKDLAKIFGFSDTITAVKLMKDWDVPHIFLGVGRKRGYRWREYDVETAISMREVGNNYSTIKSTHKPDQTDFWDQELSKIREACSRV